MAVGTKIYVGDLLENVRKSELEKEFSQFGELRDVWVAHNPPGFAFINFFSPREARNAVKALDGKNFCGSRIRVEMSKSKGPKNTGRRRNSPKRFSPVNNSDQRDRSYYQDDYVASRPVYPRRMSPPSPSPPPQRSSYRYHESQSTVHSSSTYHRSASPSMWQSNKRPYSPDRVSSRPQSKRSSTPPKYSQRRIPSPPSYHKRPPSPTDYNRTSSKGYKDSPPTSGSFKNVPTRYTDHVYDRSESYGAAYNDSKPRQRYKEPSVSSSTRYRSRSPPPQRQRSPSPQRMTSRGRNNTVEETRGHDISPREYKSSQERKRFYYD